MISDKTLQEFVKEHLAWFVKYKMHPCSYFHYSEWNKIKEYEQSDRKKLEEKYGY